MAGSVNKVIIVGNLTRDPELRRTPGGNAVADFSCATNERYKDKNGTEHESAEFHNVIIWNGLAEICARYLKKGSSVYVEGKLRTRSWEDNGIKKYRTEIVASQVLFLEKSGAGKLPVDEPPFGYDQEAEVW